MRHILHILKNAESQEALELISEQANTGKETLSLLLIQDAVHLKPSPDLKVAVLSKDLEKRKIASLYKAVDYDTMLEMIFSADVVMTW